MAERYPITNHRSVRDLSGQRFGRLLVLYRVISTEKRKNRVAWLCRCDCGIEKAVRSDHLTSGKTTSCRCLTVEQHTKRLTRHGKCGTRAWNVWQSMLQRCYDPHSTGFQDYGARGITVCTEWHTFEAFYADMGDPPVGQSIDRIQNDGGYSLSNCRWATPTEQVRNRRSTRYLEAFGQRKTLGEWAEEYSLTYDLLWGRLRQGMSPQRALTAPLRITTRTKGMEASHHRRFPKR